MTSLHLAPAVTLLGFRYLYAVSSVDIEDGHRHPCGEVESFVSIAVAIMCRLRLRWDSARILGTLLVPQMLPCLCIPNAYYTIPITCHDELSIKGEHPRLRPTSAID